MNMTTRPRHPATTTGQFRSQPPDTAPRWPFHSSLALGALPEAVPCARLHTCHIIREWGLNQFADDAELIVSELVTNGIEGTAAADLDTPVRFTLLGHPSNNTSGPASVMIAVWDGSPVPPDPGSDSADQQGLEESGRGLRIVTALAARWDWELLDPGHGGGKIVRALLQSEEPSISVPPELRFLP